jgi:hypothetical protein
MHCKPQHTFSLRVGRPAPNPPLQEAQQRIEVALERAGIKRWELSDVDNSNCVGAPLDPSLMALP